ncbi:hypothetical protein HYT01_02955 [Candidatus Giovannonibacteria bacterium]|nr:hypothetical protein [Candidatus Giovannonibacteria bacterium]
MAGLDDLRKRLYKKEENFGERMVSPDLNRPTQGRRIAWESETNSAQAPKKNSKIFWGSVTGLVFLITALLFVYFSGFSSIFKLQSLDVFLTGEKEIKSGGLTVWEVKVTNNNTVPVQDVVIIFNYPPDATPGSSKAKVVTGLSSNEKVFRERRPIGVLAPNETISESFDAFVFGKAGMTAEVSAVVEYRPEGASSVFAKDGSFSFHVGRSPISVSFDMPEEIRIGQNVEFKVSYISQASQSIDDLFLKLTLPTDFELGSASPLPLTKNYPVEPGPRDRIWKLEKLEPAKGGSIALSGVISGSELEPKNFNAVIGVLDKRSGEFLTYDESSEVVILRPLFLEVSMLVNGAKEHISSPGGSVIVRINWRNNLPTTVNDAILEARLEGSAIDLKTVRADNGSYRQSSGSIIWNAASYEPFRNMEPDDNGSVEFTFKTASELSLSSTDKRPVIKITVILKNGLDVAGFEGVDVTGTRVVEIPVSSKLQVSSRGLYSNSSIPNTGPLPPKVGVETTYSVVWSLTNMTNDLEKVKVGAALPPYITFKNVISPPNADVKYDKNTGEVTWNVGRISAGTGFVKPAVQITFQIGLIPSLDQVGFTPTLVNEAITTGKDTFTKADLSSKDQKISTSLTGDPSVGFNQRNVTQ